MIQMEEATPGLRERKKRAAREAIAATARRLFAERGFDAVTVAEVAAAADVSEKTVFNHFATKEDLALAGREEGIARLVADIAGRRPGTSVLDVFRALTATVIDDFVAGGDADLLAVARIIRGSPGKLLGGSDALTQGAQGRIAGAHEEAQLRAVPWCEALAMVPREDAAGTVLPFAEPDGRSRAPHSRKGEGRIQLQSPVEVADGLCVGASSQGGLTVEVGSQSRQ